MFLSFTIKEKDCASPKGISIFVALVLSQSKATESSASEIARNLPIILLQPQNRIIIKTNPHAIVVNL